MASTPELTSVSDASRGPAQTSSPRPHQLLGLLAGYFALQVVLRVTFSGSIDLDESEAVVLSQKFSWGYGSDPPLYVWIQTLLFRVFGTSVFALSLLKNALLLSTYLLTFATARLVTRNPAAAVAAALSLFYIPSVAWESQRDLTHSVLSATLSVATLFTFLNLRESGRLRWYLAFGVCAGCGLLSKYNYACWLMGLLTAGFILKEMRPILLNPRLLLSAGIALLIFLPNGVWMLEHRDLTMLNASNFGFQQSLSWLQITLTGIKNIIQSVTSFAAPLTLIYLSLFLKAPARATRPVNGRPEYRKLLFVSWAIIGVVLLLLVCLARATGFRERWFQPILITLPIAAIALAEDRLDRFRLRCIATLSLLVMLTVALTMPGRLLVAERLKREEPLTRPYARLASNLRPLVPPNSLLLCDTQLLAGNLRLGLADTTVLNTELWPLFRKSYSHCFLVWDARRNDSLPEKLKGWAATYHPSEIASAQTRYLSEVYRYHESKEFRLGWVQLY